MSAEERCKHCEYPLASSWKCCPNCGCDLPQKQLLDEEKDLKAVNTEANSEMREIRIGIIALACIGILALFVAFLSATQADISFSRLKGNALELFRDFILYHKFTSLAVILIIFLSLIAWITYSHPGSKSKASKNSKSSRSNMILISLILVLWIFAVFIFYIETCCNILVGK